MNRIIKNLYVIIMIIFIIFSYSLVANAADNEKTNIILKTTTKELKENDEIKVYIYMQNTEFSDGIAYIEGNIEYPKDILEPITTNDATYNGWTTSWNTETGKIAIDRGNLTNTPQEVSELKFKVKKNAKSTIINLKNIKASNQSDEVDVEDTEVTIGTNSSGNNEENNQQDQDGEDKNDENDGNKDNNEKEDGNKNPSNSKDDDSSDDGISNDNNNGSSTKEEQKKETMTQKSQTTGGATSTADANDKIKDGAIPKTGTSEFIFAILVILTIFGVFSYKKYKKYKNV